MKKKLELSLCNDICTELIQWSSGSR